MNALPDSLFELIVADYLELKDVATLVQLNQTFLERLQGYDLDCEPTQEALEARLKGLWKWTSSRITKLDLGQSCNDCHTAIELSAFPKLKCFDGGGFECLDFDSNCGIRELIELESFFYSSCYYRLYLTELQDLGFLVNNHSLTEISIDSPYEWNRMFEEFIEANIDWTGLKIFHFHENKREKLTFSIEKLIATFPDTLEKVYYHEDRNAGDDDNDNEVEGDNEARDEGDNEASKEQKPKNTKKTFLRASANSKWELVKG